MVLHDIFLRKIAQAGAIEPFNPDRVQPASIDLTLGTTFRVVRAHKLALLDLANIPDESELTDPTTINEDGFFDIMPDQFVLGRTFERVRVPLDMVGRLEGKSSLGRLGLIVHVTAGFFDPGFEGYGTLEFVNLLEVPIRLRPGLPICQFTFHQMTGTASPYAGHYTDGNDAAASRYGKDEFLTQRIPS